MKKTITLLFIDDDINFHSFMRMAIDEVDRNIQMISVYDGKQGLDYLLKKGAYNGREEGDADVVIADINMPLVNGVDFIKEINTIAALDIPIFILTDDMYRNVSSIILNKGAKNTYSKATTLPAMREIIENILDESGLSRLV